MTSRYDKLITSSDQIADWALVVEDATQQLARAANGNAEHVIPAPTVYRLLGELTTSARHLAEVTAFLPTGLANSLSEPAIAVYDRHVVTGEIRDPAQQIDQATRHLTHATAALQQFADHLEAAQTALNSQGITQPSRPPRPGLRRPLRTYRSTPLPLAASAPLRTDRGPSI